ncbi:MAG TPA: ATP-binding cassette domain-containing protein [Pseudomonadales bacterium]|nr:ATP-binding cassette domain-containing protein [Pseudomonadales bacterium]
MTAAVVIDNVVKRFPDVEALSGISATIEKGRLTGLVGPDGAGKTTLIRLIGALMQPTEGKIEIGGLEVLTHQHEVHAKTGYMPQRFGLYEELTVIENMKLYARLRGLDDAAMYKTIAQLLRFTRLEPFIDRRAGKLSGGMKQKLGLACALMARPDVLLLDEPSVGVDPVSRQDLWRMVQALTHDGMAVVWSTAYLDEADRCDKVIMLNNGKLEFFGPPQELTQRVAGRTYRMLGLGAERRRVLAETLDQDGVRDGVIQGEAIRVVLDAGASPDALRAFALRHGAGIEATTPRFEDAFIDLLGGGPGGHSAIADKMEPVELGADIAVSCKGLTKRFGDFIATQDVTFDVRKGEIFGLLGPNGAGKSTTFKMLCGLLKPTSGEARVVGLDLRRAGSEAKRRIGYMSQKFALYGKLSVKQNLDFYSGAYGLTGSLRRARIEEMIDTFELARYLKASPDTLPLGYKQRLALACALMHRPVVLFLDEPTSGVDPITRREFWTHINGLVRKGVTTMVTTHFMDETEYCDRVALMYQARVIALGSPDALKAQVATQDRPDPTMEDAFIRLVQAVADGAQEAA